MRGTHTHPLCHPPVSEGSTRRLHFRLNFAFRSSSEDCARPRVTFATLQWLQRDTQRPYPRGGEHSASFFRMRGTHTHPLCHPPVNEGSTRRLHFRLNFAFRSSSEDCARPKVTFATLQWLQRGTQRPCPRGGEHSASFFSEAWSSYSPSMPSAGKRRINASASFSIEFRFQIIERRLRSPARRP
jgi:hypothetical protein